MTEEERKALDGAVLRAVGHLASNGWQQVRIGDVRSTGWVHVQLNDLCARYPRKDRERFLDGSLQRLRRAGKLTFSSKLGWRTSP